MKLFRVLMVLLLAAPAVAADRPVLLITPAGVWRSDLTNGVPGAWVVQNVDVIVSGFNGGGNIPNPQPPTDPPASDPVVTQVAAISKANLKDATEATAVASIVDSLMKFGLTGAKFKEALNLAIPIADTSLQADGRLKKWANAALAVTTDGAKLRAGIKDAFAIQASTLDAIHSTATDQTGAAVTGEALNWTQIIEIIQMIIQLLKNLGVIE